MENWYFSHKLDSSKQVSPLSLSLKKLGAFFLLLGSLEAKAQQRDALPYFQDDAAAQRTAATSPLAKALRSSRSLTLDVAGLQLALNTAPLEGRPNTTPTLLTLPMPSGRNERFRIVESPVMEPGLAAKFPQLKTYSGVGIDDPTASVRLDMTSQGFHAQVLSDRHRTVYIDPATRTDKVHYLSYDKDAMPAMRFKCAVPAPTTPPSRHRSALRTTGQGLRIYRLAVAATGEYTSFQGGTVEAAQAAIVTSVNRVVGVYEKELAIRFVLVSNNSSLIYTDASTDPYTNNDGGIMLGENQRNVDAVIGSANYDIGHVFSTGGGGIASLGATCDAGRKAMGVTGSDSPVSDSFDIDYVAHEIGHEVGANHPFNSNTDGCGNDTRNASTAYEPGSGSTIMAYAGLCGSDSNTQLHSDAYFHVVNYEEIMSFLATTSCGTTTATGNTPPTVTTLPAGGKVLPISTPFKLTAVGSDADGDPLTYCWEQYDLGSAGTALAAQQANDPIPLFRSFLPSTSPTRYFPRLSSLVNNTTVLGERLPTVSRPLTFRVTLRDQHNGSAGVIGGINSSSTVSLSSTSAAGPFVVTAPNTAVSWAGGSTQTVTWNVANTNVSPVSCATVNIRLSTDGGFTYPTVLLAGTPNDGTQAITVPNLSTSTARVMVEAADNYFFDISDANFTIAANTAACNPVTNLSVGSITATSASVSFTASAGASNYVVTTSPATTTYTVTASPVSLTGLTAGTTYTVNVTTNCSGGTPTTASTTFSTTSARPANDECAGALTLVSNTSCTNTSGTTNGATQSQVAVTCNGYASYTANDLWYSFVATGRSHKVTATGTFDGVLEGFSGSCGALSSMSCADSTGDGGTETLRLSGLTPNTRYYVRYFPYTGSTTRVDGTFTICVTGAGTVAASCAAPTTLRARNITRNSARINFTASAGASSYRVTTSPATTTRTVTASPVQLTGLAAGTTYTVSIVTSCTNGASSQAATTTFTTSTTQLTAVNPSAEKAGSPVELTGTGFTTGSKVTFAGVQATSVTYHSPTSLTAVVPSGVATGEHYVMVHTAEANSDSLHFTVLAGQGSAAQGRGVQKKSASSSLSLFPNPTHNAATLTGATPGAVVQVYNVVGHLVLTTKADAQGTATLNLPAGLAPGIYQVRTGTTPALRLEVR